MSQDSSLKIAFLEHAPGMHHAPSKSLRPRNWGLFFSGVKMMTELEKLTAWHNAAKSSPILQKLFPPSETEGSGKYFIWSGHYYEYEAGKWSHHGWDEDDHDSIVEALGGDGIEQIVYDFWSTLGCYASSQSTVRLLQDMAVTYQWYCSHPDRACDSVPVSEMEEWAKDRIPSVEEITKEIEEDPIKPVFPVEQQLTIGGI